MVTAAAPILKNVLYKEGMFVDLMVTNSVISLSHYLWGKRRTKEQGYWTRWLSVFNLKLK